VPAQHVWLRDPVMGDRLIIGHVAGMFKRVGEACSSVGPPLMSSIHGCRPWERYKNPGRSCGRSDDEFEVRD